MVAAIMTAVAAALGWYYPRWVGVVPNRLLAGLLGVVGGVAVVVLLLIAGAIAAASNLVSTSSAGAAAIAFGAFALASVAKRAIAERGLRAATSNAVQPQVARSLVAAGQPGNLNWSEGLFRTWVVVTLVWAAINAAAHMAGVVYGNLRPEVAIASFLLWAALPPLAVGVLALGVRWAIAGFRRDIA